MRREKLSSRCRPNVVTTNRASHNSVFDICYPDTGRVRCNAYQSCLDVSVLLLSTSTMAVIDLQIEALCRTRSGKAGALLDLLRMTSNKLCFQCF